MGWTEQIPNLIIFESGSGGFTGLYCYDPAPGVNNLLASIAAPSISTDPYGNPVVGGGFAAYDAVGNNENRLIFIGSQSISMRTGNASEATHARLVTTVVASRLQLNINSASSTGAADTTEIDLNSNTLTGTDVAKAFLIYNDSAAVEHDYLTWSAAGAVISAGSITAVTPGTGTLATPATSETWHSLGSPSATGFTSNIGQYRLTAEGETEIDVLLTAGGGGGTAGTYSYANTLPTAYRPPTTRIYPLGFNSTYVAGAAANALIVNSTGVVQVKVSALVAATIAGTSVRVPLNV